jgi:membrane associated rhomboid family serine protease
MMVTRIGSDVVRLDDEEWARWARDGRIPPDAQVQMPGQGWVRADGLTAWHWARAGAGSAAGPEATGPSLREVVFPGRGISATEVILAVNILVSGVLVILWGDDYTRNLWANAGDWWRRVHDEGGYFWWLPTLFLHADPGHLFRNLVALLAGAAACEFLLGARRTVFLYLATGLAGAAVSFFMKDQPPLSVGASGAAFGLAGAALGVIVRRYRVFSYRQKWKARRVYLPLFVVFVGQSLLNADWMAHSGGFFSGVLLGLFLPLHPRVAQLAEAADAHREIEDL